MPSPIQPTQDLGTLWTLTKDGHDARADVRAIEGVGFELRYLWDGDLRVSEVFRELAALDQAAARTSAAGWKRAAGLRCEFLSGQP
jgi:hypothetical protein